MSRLRKPKSLIPVNVVASLTGRLYHKGVKRGILNFRPEIITLPVQLLYCASYYLRPRISENFCLINFGGYIFSSNLVLDTLIHLS